MHILSPSLYPADLIGQMATVRLYQLWSGYAWISFGTVNAQQVAVLLLQLEHLSTGKDRHSCS